MLLCRAQVALLHGKQHLCMGRRRLCMGERRPCTKAHALWFLAEVFFAGISMHTEFLKDNVIKTSNNTGFKKTHRNTLQIKKNNYAIITKNYEKQNIKKEGNFIVKLEFESSLALRLLLEYPSCLRNPRIQALLFWFWFLFFLIFFSLFSFFFYPAKNLPS